MSGSSYLPFVAPNVERSPSETERLMNIVLVRRLEGLHALLEMALEAERSRVKPDDRTLAGIKKRKLAIRDRLARADAASARSTVH